jgi:hypothetical protein
MLLHLACLVVGTFLSHFQQQHALVVKAVLEYMVDELVHGYNWAVL